MTGQLFWTINSANIETVPEKPLPFIALQSVVSSLADECLRKNWDVKQAFAALLAERILFPGRGAMKMAKVVWPHVAGDREIALVVRVNVRNQSLAFYEGNILFLKLYCGSNNELIVSMTEALLTSSIWQERDVHALANYFNQIFCASKLTYLNAPSHIGQFNKASFERMIATYPDGNIAYRIQKVLINHATQRDNSFLINFDWVDAKNRSHLLEANFSRSDIFLPPSASKPGYSWVLTEPMLLRQFQDYKKYCLKSGLNYYGLRIFEVILPQHAKPKKNEVLNMWFTMDGSLGELHHVARGDRISGNDVLDIYNSFDALFRVKHTFICDASNIYNADESQSVPLRLLLALADGKTWYEKKIPGVRLFDCVNFQTVANGCVSQSGLKRKLALCELQNLTLKRWSSMLEVCEQRCLIKLYQRYYSAAVVPYRHSARLEKKLKKVDAISTLDPTTNLQSLAQKIYQRANENKTFPHDALTLIKLLAGSLLEGEEAVDAHAADAWVKRRVKVLLWGSVFWVKEACPDEKLLAISP